MGGNGMMVRCGAVGLLTAAIVVGFSAPSMAAQRQVFHQQGASAGAFFNSCPSVADGEACAFTILEVSTTHSAQDQTLNGDCVYLDQIRGVRQSSTSLTATSETLVQSVCGEARVVVPRSLTSASASGTLPTSVCSFATGACQSGQTTIDVRWTGVGAITRLGPFTSRYADYDFGLPCVYHQTVNKTRNATVVASMTDLDLLGAPQPGDESLTTGGDLFIGQHVGSCID